MNFIINEKIGNPAVAEVIGKGYKSANIFQIMINGKVIKESTPLSRYLVNGELFECTYVESNGFLSDYDIKIYGNKPIIRDSLHYKYTNLTKLDVGSWLNAHTNTFYYEVGGIKHQREQHCDTLNSDINLYKVFYNVNNPQIGYLVKH